MKKIIVFVSVILAMGLHAGKNNFLFKLTNNTSRTIYLLFKPINDIIKPEYFAKLSPNQTLETQFNYNRPLNLPKKYEHSVVLYLSVDQLPDSFSQLYQFSFNAENQKDIILELNERINNGKIKGFETAKDIFLTSKGSGLFKKTKDGKSLNNNIKNDDIQNFTVIGSAILGDQTRARRQTVRP